MNYIHETSSDPRKKSGSIGQPTPFMDVKIVDGEGSELSPGNVGELLLTGPRLMKEYAFNPEMTAGTITDGWLHTGDLAYKVPLAAGTIENGYIDVITERCEREGRFITKEGGEGYVSGMLAVM